MTQQIPVFKGSVVETPYNFLSGDFGRWADQESRALARNEFHDNAIFHQEIGYNEKKQVVEGSHSFYLVLLNLTFRRNGLGHLRTATQADLERIIRTQALPLKGYYEDSALVLRTAQQPNKYLAQLIMKQTILRTRKKQRAPLMIPLDSLELENDSSSRYGLAFKLREDAVLIEAPILNQPGRFTSADIDPAIGLPRTTGEQGDRALYAIDSGLSRLGLGRHLGLNSSWVALAGSYGSGRAVVVDTKKLDSSNPDLLSNIGLSFA